MQSLSKYILVLLMAVGSLYAHEQNRPGKKLSGTKHHKVTTAKIKQALMQALRLKQSACPSLPLNDSCPPPVGCPPCPPPPNFGTIVQNPDAYPVAFYPYYVSNQPIKPPFTASLTFVASSNANSPSAIGNTPQNYGICAGSEQLVYSDNSGMISFDKQGVRDGIVGTRESPLSIQMAIFLILSSRRKLPYDLILL